MAAVSQGAREGGGRAIGVTVELLAQTRSPNPWIDQEVRTAALLERIDKLIDLGDGYAVLPGGAGTLLELGAVWNLALLGALHGKPIVVVGLGWQRILDTMVAHLHTVESDLQHLILAPDASSAADILAERLR
jgi:predicted Rossmann-fold nucleotide-binding protein